LLLAVVGSAFGVWAEDSGAGSTTNRLWLEITVGECERELQARLPETTSKRLSTEDLKQHNPTAPVLTQRLALPAKGRVTQELRCDEFTIHLDLDFQHIAKENAVHGGVSSSFAAGSNGLRRPAHWNCFAVAVGLPLYLGYVRAGHAAYLIVGRFQLAPPLPPTNKERE
jgi:hypothetical protein